MRWEFLVVATLLIGGASASPLATERVLEDPAGDYVIHFADSTSQPDPTNPSMDLRFLEIIEYVDGFDFTIGVEALERPGDDFTVQANVWVVSFTHGAQDYEFNFIWGIDGGWRTDMYRVDPSGGYENFHDAAIERDFEAGTVTSFVARDLLRDENGAPPLGGKAFTDITVRVESLTFNNFVFGRDDMPDAEMAPATYDIQWGVQSEGPIAMGSELPFRSSNGAATTYLFELGVVNLDDASHRYFFREPELPAGWEIRFPADGMVLEAGETRVVPVLVSLPFAHQHGTIERTIIELVADDGLGIGRTEIGVLFLETPQPSGHHPQVWFHSTEQVAVEEAGWHFAYTPGADVYMNTLKTDEVGDALVPIRGYSYDEGYEWYVFLEPGLLTGLDFRVGEEGTVTVPISTDRPIPQASLSGSLILMGPETQDSYDDRPGSATRGNTDFGGRELTTIATIEASKPADLRGAYSYERPLVLEPGTDVIEPLPGQTLLLRLRLEGQIPALYAAEPVLIPGGTMMLPLDEYADPVDTTFFADVITLEPTSAQERWANPGDVLVMTANVGNLDQTPMVTGLELSGQGAAWATIEANTEQELAPGDEYEARIIVRIPEYATHADRADMVLEAFSVDDPSVRSLVSFVAHVDTEQEWDDDRALVVDEAPKSTPIGTLVAVLAVALALALRRAKDE